MKTNIGIIHRSYLNLSGIDDNVTKVILGFSLISHNENMRSVNTLNTLIIVATETQPIYKEIGNLINGFTSSLFTEMIR